MKKVIYSAALMLSLVLGACDMTADYSPQEILNQAMEETTDISSYYAEYIMTIDGEGSYTAKQWEKNGKTRIEMVDATGEETITVNDGKTVTMYNKTQNSGSSYSLASDMEDFVRPTLKEQALQTLEIVKDTHDISIGESEKIAGRDTYHLVTKAKEKNSLFGDIEVWVDKKTWMTLKTVTITEDMQLTMEFTKFEPDAKIAQDQFILELPADANIETTEVTMPEQITATEAKEMLGDFLSFPASTGYELLTIENMNVSETNEIALTYLKDGEPAFTLSVFRPTDAMEFSPDSSLQVRGLPAEKMDLNSFRFLQWDENELRYGIILENPDLTFEDVITLTENMQILQ